MKLRIEFIDSGVGISPENLPKVFNEIVQFNANQNQGGKGSGLGLYISRGIVELHEGTVSVTSKGIGHGCIFSVELPLIYHDWTADSDIENQGASQGLEMNYESNSAAFNSANTICERENSIVKTNRTHCNQLELSDLEGGGGGAGGAGGGEISGRTKKEKKGENLYKLTVSSLSIDSLTSPAISDPHSATTADAITSIADPLTNRKAAEDNLFAKLTNSPIEENKSKRAPSPTTITTTISAALPAAAAVPAVATSVPTTIKPQRIMYLRNKKLLVVDDSQVNLKMTVMLLRKYGAECIQATDGSEAIQIMKDDIKYLQQIEMAKIHSTSISSHRSSHRSSHYNTGGNAGGEAGGGSGGAGEGPGGGGGGGVLKLKSNRTRTFFPPSSSSSSTSTSSNNHQISLNLPTKSSFDMIIMDNLMPQICGPEACQIIRSLGYQKLILGLTGNALGSDIEEYIKSGADYVLKKPIDINELERVLQRVDVYKN